MALVGEFEWELVNWQIEMSKSVKLMKIHEIQDLVKHNQSCHRG